MNGWVKYFGYDNPEYGDDEYVSKRSASWSRGKLDNMIGAEIYHNDIPVIRLNGFSKYHQSDDFCVSVYQSTPKRVMRRLQRQINPAEEFVVGDLYENKINAFFAPADIIFSDKHYSLFCGLHDCSGQWLTVEYDIEYDKIGMYITKDKI